MITGARSLAPVTRRLGVPDKLIEAIRAAETKNLTCVSNNAGIDGAGLGILLKEAADSRR